MTRSSAGLTLISRQVRQRGLARQSFIELGENEDGDHQRDVDGEGDKNHHASLLADRTEYEGFAERHLRCLCRCRNVPYCGTPDQS